MKIYRREEYHDDIRLMQKMVLGHSFTCKTAATAAELV